MGIVLDLSIATLQKKKEAGQWTEEVSEEEKDAIL